MQFTGIGASEPIDASLSFLLPLIKKKKSNVVTDM